MKIGEKTTIRLDELVNIGDSILQNKVCVLLKAAEEVLVIPAIIRSMERKLTNGG